MDSSNHICTVCNYIYDEKLGDPANNIAPGTDFASLPETFACPGCGADRQMFQPCSCVSLQAIQAAGPAEKDLTLCA